MPEGAAEKGNVVSSGVEQGAGCGVMIPTLSVGGLNAPIFDFVASEEPFWSSRYEDYLIELEEEEKWPAAVDWVAPEIKGTEAEPGDGYWQPVFIATPWMEGVR